MSNAPSFLYPDLNTALNAQGWYRRVTVRSTPNEWDSDDYMPPDYSRRIRLYRDGLWEVRAGRNETLVVDGQLANGLPNLREQS